MRGPAGKTPPDRGQVNRLPGGIRNSSITISGSVSGFGATGTGMTRSDFSGPAGGNPGGDKNGDKPFLKSVSGRTRSRGRRGERSGRNPGRMGFLPAGSRAGGSRGFGERGRNRAGGKEC